MATTRKLFDKMFRPMGRTGWYLMRDGQSHGPYAIDDLLSIQHPSSYFVSRRNLAQWYPLDEFMGFVQRLDAVGPVHNGSDVFGLNSKVDVKAFEQFKGVQSMPEVRRKTIRPKAGGVAAKSSRARSYPASSFETMDAIRHSIRDPETGRAHLARRWNLRPFRVRDAITSLRLGETRKAGFSELTRFCFSLGLSFLKWFDTLWSEIDAHLHEKVPMQRTKPNVALAIIPLHFIGIFKLARMIQQMEKENGYQHTHAGLAVALAVFPPLSMVYLQRCANRHWQAHIQAEWKNRSS
jgi:hypothetical protein